jgi:hypothetical protein
MSLISGRIAAWVSRQRLDHLTAPTVDDPRAALHSEFEGADFRRLLSRFGAELVRVNIGHLDTPSPVDSQRIESWQSIWQLQDKITLAQGEAVQLAYEELGRAEGQAEMLKAIARALEDILPNPPAGDMEISRLVILRISQLLDTMSPREKLGEPKAPPTASSGPKQ